MSLADDLDRNVRDGAEEGLRAAAEAVLAESNRNLPVGDPAEDPDPAVSLLKAGKVERLSASTYQVSYDTEYAAYQHENLNARHPRGGGPKFLEHALTTLAPQLEGYLATAVRAQIDQRAGARGRRPRA